MIHSAAFLHDWDIHNTATFINRRGFKRLALQFPDHLLADSSNVAAALRQNLGADRGVQLFVLADSTYHSLGVDEVGAAHVNADCVVHYGYASLAPVSTTTAYFVFPKQSLNVQQAATDLLQYATACSATQLLIFPDQALEGEIPELETAIQERHKGPCRIAFARVAARQLDPPRMRQQLPQSCGHQPTGAPSTIRGPPTTQSEVDTATATTPSQKLSQTPSTDTDGSVSQQLSHLQLAGCTACSCSNQVQDDGAVQAAASSTAVAESTHCIPSSASSIPDNPVTDRHVDDRPPDQTGCGTSCASGCSAACRRSARQGGQVSSTRGGAGVRQQVLGEPGSKAEDLEGSAPSDGDGERLLSWRVPVGMLADGCSCVWLGEQDSPLLLPLHLTLNQMAWSSYNPQACSWQEGLLPQVPVLLKKRYYLVEKARGANIVGLLVGTLGNASCLPALERVRNLAEGAGKKTYTILMGKPAPQKLANFPEIEVFVMLADPQGLILDSKEFYAPIITPYEAMLAFTGQPWTGQYSLELEAVLRADIDASDLSEAAAGALTLSGAGALISQPNQGGELVIKSAAQYLTKRSWQGLESPLTGAEKKPAELAQQGFAGRAATYTHEPHAG